MKIQEIELYIPHFTVFVKKRHQSIIMRGAGVVVQTELEYDHFNDSNYERNDNVKALLEKEKFAFANFWKGVLISSHLFLDIDDSVKIRHRPNFKRSTTSALESNDLNKTIASAKLRFEGEGLKYIIHPDDLRKITWDAFISLFIIYSAISIPLKVGFRLIVPPKMIVFDFCVDFIFFVDICITFCTAYYDPISEKIITSRRKIVKNYLQFWFWLDLASTVPIDALVNSFTGGDGNSLSSIRLIRMFRLSRLFKLLRLLKLSRLGAAIESLNINPALLGVFKLIMQICFVAHFVCCFWFFIGSEGATTEVRNNIPGRFDPDPTGSSWITRFGYDNVEIGDKYVGSFYWTITTMLTIGYGDIYAVNYDEKLYAIFTMLIGSILFGAVIAQVTRLIATRNPQARIFKEKMDELKAYLNEKMLPPKLKIEAKESYMYYLTQKTIFAERGVLQELPTSLLNPLTLSIYNIEIHNLNFFRSSDDSFVVKLVLNCKPFQAPSGVLLLEKGDVPDEIIFILRGVIQFTTTDGVVEAIAGYNSEGGYCGDFEYYKRITRLVSHKALSSCILLSLSTRVLEEALLSFPHVAERVQSEFESRYKAFVKAKQSTPVKRLGSHVWTKSTIFVNGVAKIAIDDRETHLMLNRRASVENTRSFELIATINLSKSSNSRDRIEETELNILKRCIVLPTNTMKIRWDIFVGALILYSIVVIPVQIAFNRRATGPLAVVDYFIDVVFFFDIVVSTRTAYYSENDDAYMTIPLEIMKHYFYSWFWIDTISVLPVDTIFQLITGETTGVLKSLKLLKVIRLMRLLKLSRMVKLRKYLINIEDRLGINPATFELFKLILQVIFVGHIIGCIYWYLSFTISTKSWIDEMNLRDDTLFRQYVTALYWTFTTLSTVGFGDIVPLNTAERVVTICTMLLGATVFGFIAANVSALMASLDIGSTKVNARLAEINEYLREKNSPPHITKVVIAHFKHVYSQSSAFDEKAILSRLPLFISRKMIAYQHSITLGNIAIFPFIESKGVVLFLFRKMVPNFFDVSQYIATEGEIAVEIIFVTSGCARIFRKSKKLKPVIGQREKRILHSSSKSVPIELCSIVGELSVGDFLGHISLMKKKPFTASVVSIQPVSSYSLSEVEIAKILRDFPAVAMSLQSAIGGAMNSKKRSYKSTIIQKRAQFIHDLSKQFLQSRAKSVVNSSGLDDVVIRRTASWEVGSSYASDALKKNTAKRRKSLESIQPQIDNVRFIPAKNKVVPSRLYQNNTNQTNEQTQDSELNDTFGLSYETKMHDEKSPSLNSQIKYSDFSTVEDFDVLQSKPQRNDVTFSLKSDPRKISNEFNMHTEERRPSRWNIVQAVVHDPVAIAIVKQQLQKDTLGRGNADSRALFNEGRVNYSELTKPRWPGIGNNGTMANVVKNLVKNNKANRSLAFLNGNEFYDSDEDEMRKNDLFAHKTKTLKKKRWSCPDFIALVYDDVGIRQATSFRRCISYPSFDFAAWKEDNYNEHIL